jgi:hypothetical protein
MLKQTITNLLLLVVAPACMAYVVTLLIDNWDLWMSIRSQLW